MFEGQQNPDEPKEEKAPVKKPKPINQELSSEIDELLKTPVSLDDPLSDDPIPVPGLVNPEAEPSADKSGAKEESKAPETPKDKDLAKKEDTPKKSKKSVRRLVLPVSLGISLVIVAALCACTFVCATSNPKPDFGTFTPPEEAAKACITDKASFDELTKESAFEWLRVTQNDKNCSVDNVFGDNSADFVLDDIDTDSFFILYSYSDPDDIQKIANNSVMNSTKRDVEFTVTQKDGYAIVRDDTRKSCGDKCYVGIIFDKNYVNFYKDEKIDQYSARAMNDRLVITKFDKDWIKTALDILNTESFLHSFYESSIEFDGTNYIYTTHNIGTGLDMANQDQFQETGFVPYAINLYETKTVIDPSGQVVKQNIASDGGYMNVLKTFPLTQEEAEELGLASETEDI